MTAKTRKFGPRLTVSLKPIDRERVEKVAEEQGASASWVVRRAIEEYFSKTQNSNEIKLSIQTPKASESKNNAA